MQPATKTVSIAVSTPPECDGGMLHCGGPRSDASGTQTHARIADDIAQQAARRIGTLAVLTAVTTVAAAVLQHALQPDLGAVQQPLYRLSALFLVLAGAGLAALERAEIVGPQDLLDLGLVFEVAGAFALALLENAAPWPDSPIRGATVGAAWIAICVVVIPNQPWKSIAAAAASAAAVPCAHLIAAQVLGYPGLPWNRLASYSLGPLYVVAWTPFISMRLHRLHEDLSRSQDFGSYRLERLLGRGGMGEVWLGHHRFLRRDAAVKLVLAGLWDRAGHSERRQIQKRFETEAQAIASLESPHTVAVYDYGLAENGSLYYAMEYLHGLDAEALVKESGPLPAGRVVSFLRQACESLEEAHDLGLVHRDLKASNLFICRLGKRTDFVKVLDFGLVKGLAATATHSVLTTSRTSGTPAFMAPEQVRGEDVDARADIYALGCLAYYLLTGTVVFNKPDAMAMAVAHLIDRPEPPSMRAEVPIPESLERIVLACLRKRREDRPQSVAALGAMLDTSTDVTPWTEADANQWWTLHRPEPVRKAS